MSITFPAERVSPNVHDVDMSCMKRKFKAKVLASKKRGLDKPAYLKKGNTFLDNIYNLLYTQKQPLMQACAKDKNFQKCFDKLAVKTPLNTYYKKTLKFAKKHQCYKKSYLKTKSSSTRSKRSSTRKRK